MGAAVVSVWGAMALVPPRERPFWPEGGAPMIAMMRFAHFELFANLQPIHLGGRRVTTRLVAL